MKRREFLKGLSAAASVVAIPVLSILPEKKWETAGDIRVRQSHLWRSTDNELFVYESNNSGLTWGNI